MSYCERLQENSSISPSPGETREIFPWQTRIWQLLWEAKQKNRLPHALLFVGACDLEKKQFAEVLGAAMLCEQASVHGKTCGRCHGCHLVRAKSHSDLMVVEPAEPGQMIKIDQIRGVISFVNATAMQGGFRVIIVSPAHAMNLAATNALLKTLEEPTPNTLLILISNQSLRLAATMTSRCQKIFFQKPARDVALTWLQTQLSHSHQPFFLKDEQGEFELLLNLAEGAPLKAMELVTEGVAVLRQEMYQGLTTLSQGQADPLHLALQWQEHDVLIIFKLILNWLRDILRFKLTHGQVELINSDYQVIFKDIVQKISTENLLLYLDLVSQGYKKMVNMQNLNKQLLLEEILIRWVNYVSR